MSKLQSSTFNEIPVFCDDKGWVWEFLETVLKSEQVSCIKVGSDTSVRQSWNRYKSSARIIVHWEGKLRIGGAIVEEMTEINPVFDIANNVIVVTSSPVREDIVYLSELGIKRVIRLRQKDEDVQKAARELKQHLESDFSPDRFELAWQKIQKSIDFLPKEVPATRLDKLHFAISRLGQLQTKTTARYLDACASIAAARNENEKAEKLWHEAIHANPNFFRAYNKLADFYIENSKFDLALETLHRIHNLNKQRISRLVQFGDIHLKLNDDYKAEHYFKRALAEDAYHSGALNGLAEIRFREGNLEETRQLLERTALAGRFASQLNAKGIKLVRENKYAEALEHYTRAQFVLPQREKGPRLFFNIGLCYFRWGKKDMSTKFLKLAVIKEPNYKKAQELLVRISDDHSNRAKTNAA